MRTKLKGTFSERMCARCGKVFTSSIPLSQYTFKKNDHGKTIYFCCDSCKRAYEDKYGRSKKHL